MFAHLSLLQKYLAYLIKASNGKGHGIHSPFVFDFIINVLNDKTPYEAYRIVEAQRKLLQKDRSVLKVTDYGAGSLSNTGKIRTVRSISKSAVKPARYGQLLFRMARYYKPQYILELGTSLGITTSYLALANSDVQVITIEGSGAIAGKAKELFSQSALQNIEQVIGNFDELLPQLLEKKNVPDMVFIDGNHRYEPTLRYFNQLLEKTHNDTILVFDDIHWSNEMEKAWTEITRHPAVTTSIDLFFIGIIFFRKEFKEKQHFVIRF